MSVEDKCFKPLTRLCIELEEPLEKDDCALGLSDKNRAKLCQLLGSEYYTYLTLSDGLCHEVVRVEQSKGLLFVERGFEDTNCQDWPCGTQLTHEVTYAGLLDMARKTNEKIESEKCPEERFTGEIKNGNCTVFFEDGVAVKEVPLKKQIPDGEYHNPSITYLNGCQVRVVNGKNKAAQLTHSCPKSTCDPCDTCG